MLITHAFFWLPAHTVLTFPFPVGHSVQVLEPNATGYHILSQITPLLYALELPC